MKLLVSLSLVYTLFFASVNAQQYYEDEPPVPPHDTLYADYAQRQHYKDAAAAVKTGFGYGALAASGALGWLVGAKFHTRRLAAKLAAKHKAEQKQLYQQYYTDVYTLQQQNEELMQALQKMGVKVK